MLKLILVFLITFIVVYAGIEFFRILTKKEKWALTRQLGYSIIVAVVAIVLLTTIVILF